MDANRAMQIEKNSSPFAAERVDSLSYKHYCQYVRNFIPRIRLYDKILDVGCSYGHETRALQRQFSEAEVYGIDLDVEFCEHVDKSSIGYMEALPFRDETFDVVYANQVLEHSPDVNKAINEMWRVLKWDGYLVAGVPLDGWIPDLGKNESHLWRPASMTAAFQEFIIPCFELIREEFIDAGEMFGLKHDQSMDNFATFLWKKVMK